MAEAEARQKLRLAEGLARAADAAEGVITTHARKQRAAGRRAEQAQAAAQAEADKARKVRVSVGPRYMSGMVVERNILGNS